MRVTPEAEPEGAMPLLIDVSDPAVVEAWTASMRAHASQLRARDHVELQLGAGPRPRPARRRRPRPVPLYPNDPALFDSLVPLSRSARRFWMTAGP